MKISAKQFIEKYADKAVVFASDTYLHSFLDEAIKSGCLVVTREV